MTTNNKRALAIAGAGVLGLFLFFGYRQYRKIMSYTIKMGGTRLRKADTKEVIFEQSVVVNNFADIPIVIKSQLYDVYVNNRFLTRVSSGTRTVIPAKGSQTFPLVVSMKTSDLSKVIGTNWAGILLQPERVSIRTIFEVKLSLWGIGIPVKNEFSITLAEILKSKQAGATQ